MKNNDKNTNTFSDSCNNDLFFELSDYEASINSGGFDITNNLNNKVNYYSWDEPGGIKKRTLQPGKTQAFKNEYILYDGDLSSGFNPVLFEPPSRNEKYNFERDGNDLELNIV
ncbi:hypothetical protein [Nostoc sp. CCY 9925]|uniref:hypothetical protein n=1 Tax=Nostoc sp. CCY 9925 TaxID=3103865 RepID=UPI0039C7550D